jgi:hypothetical protein
MSVQQTGVSMPGGGRRAQGVVVPEAIEEAIGKEAILKVIEARNPGLTFTLYQLKCLIGSKNAKASAELPTSKLKALAVKSGTSNMAKLGTKAALEDIATEVTVTVSGALAVAALHEILRLGVEAYLSEEAEVCRYCELPILPRATGDGTDVVWFHRDTTRIMCADGGTTAKKLRRARRGPAEDLSWAE